MGNCDELDILPALSLRLPCKHGKRRGFPRFLINRLQ